MEELKSKVWGLLFTILAPIAITVAGNYIQTQLTMARVEERIAIIKEQSARHELEKRQEITRLSANSEDHGQRIIRLETNLDTIQSTLKEMRADIKTLIRGMKD